MRAALVLVALALAGCASAPPPAADAPDAWRERACEHPWPCGDGSEWPLDLATPEGGFATLPVLALRVPMDDGVELDGAAWLPEVPEGVRVPVVIWATPYAGQCRYSRLDNVPPSCDEEPAGADNLAAELEFLVAEGYAAMVVSMRGTGLSGGCFDYYGARGQRDMAALAQWAGEQPWSNGRVGMWGVSAMGTTPWMAAIHAPPALKAIAPSGIVSDLFLNRFTPQGATAPEAATFHAGWAGFNSVVPPGGALPTNAEELAARAPRLAEAAPARFCEGIAETLGAGASGQVADERSPTFWEERRLLAGFPNVTAAALVVQGFHDTGHAFQDDLAWSALERAPKRMLLGPWGHTHLPDEPDAGGEAGVLDGSPAANGARAAYLEWFGFWLKGLGEPPRVGVVDARATGDAWRALDAWPPSAARAEALYLAGGALAPAPGGASSFRAVAGAAPAACGGAEAEGTALRFATEPLAQGATLAGNPFAFLDVTSDAPGGIVAVDLWETDASGECLARVSVGGADLRWHEGGARAEAFPQGAPTRVRIDLYGTAHRFAEGSRALVVVSGTGDAEFRAAPPYAPQVTLGPESHLVLPLVEGTLGGGAPLASYPPRPRG